MHEPSPTPVTMTIHAQDGEPLAATLYPAARGPLARALIAPAMGVPQRFYASFARWLACQGVQTLTFDYRGIGASRSRPLRQVQADLMTWATQDATAALHAARGQAQAPQDSSPLWWIGHSLGGQILPFVQGHEAITQAFHITAGSGYWRMNSPALKRRVWLLWWGAVPALTPLFGYFPGARLGMVGDLPRGAIMQWRRWCLDPSYVAGAMPQARERFAQVRAPIDCVTALDDELISPQGIQALHALYTSAPITHHVLDPSQRGLERIGHFGFFHKRMEATLWAPLLRPHLDEAEASSSGAKSA